MPCGAAQRLFSPIPSAVLLCLVRSWPAFSSFRGLAGGSCGLPRLRLLKFNQDLLRLCFLWSHASGRTISLMCAHRILVRSFACCMMTGMWWRRAHLWPSSARLWSKRKPTPTARANAPHAPNSTGRNWRSTGRERWRIGALPLPQRSMKRVRRYARRKLVSPPRPPIGAPPPHKRGSSQFERRWLASSWCARSTTAR